MLEELRIQNFAIIDRLELSFAPGLNVITGETGAGKSIIVDAVELLLGGKADAGMIRSGAERATIEGVFALRGLTRGLLLPMLEREDLLADGDDVVTLYREVRANGRSIARVNGVSVNQDVLREVGDTLVDIHGQSEHLSLLNPRSHLDLLDRYADLMGMRAALQTLVDVLHTIRAEIRALEVDKDALERRAEMLRHEIEDIESADLDPAEEGDLRAERTKLSNSEQLATLAASIVTLLSGDAAEDLPGVDRMQQVAAALGKLAAIDTDLRDWAEVAEGIAAQVQDLAVEMADYADTVEYNPQRLNDIEERLEVINKLKRRYNADSITALLARASAARDALAGIENSDERLEDLRRQERDKLIHIGDLANKISAVRKTVGKQLAKRVMRELADLRMERAEFEIGIEQDDDPDGCIVGERRLAFDATGIDKVEMLLSANPGEALRPLAKVASGGEAARIMLALKRVLTAADHTPTLIFDEVDQGIGGRIGTVVGEKLWTLTHGHQVMVVTHLPQLAGFADRHYHVKKIAQADRTSTQVTMLDNEADRISELAAMLGTIGESGMASARDILTEAAARKIAAQGAATEG
ncbi:MAG: DNA repair protein RecN [Chloroflexi bacterium OLB13]|nr:MAG: DNA repair protein RecN [Chloroflexi bacterium OLB13]